MGNARKITENSCQKISNILHSQQTEKRNLMAGVALKKVKPEDDGMRLNRWFLKYYPGLSLGRFQKLLRTKQIKVDGARAEASLKLYVGQEIRIPPLDDEKALPTRSQISVKDSQFI